MSASLLSNYDDYAGTFNQSLDYDYLNETELINSDHFTDYYSLTIGETDTANETLLHATMHHIDNASGEHLVSHGGEHVGEHIGEHIVELAHNITEYVYDHEFTEMVHHKLNEFHTLLETWKENTEESELLLLAAIVLLGQFAHAFLEAGSIRSKNATSVFYKTILVTAVTTISFWVSGWAFAFGEPHNLFASYGQFFSVGVSDKLSAKWFFHLVLAAHVGNVACSTLLERSKHQGCAILAALLTCAVYPVVLHWAWSPTGWLYKGSHNVSFEDHSGSGVIHLFAGTSAAVSSFVLGPRTEIFHIPMRARGHSSALQALGGFMGLVRLFALNAVGPADVWTPHHSFMGPAAKNSILASCFAAISTVIFRRVRRRKGPFSLLQLINGSLAGAVAVAAGCTHYHAWAAALIGAISGVVYTSLAILIRFIGIDDPINTISVHFGGGLLGLLLAPFLMDNGIFFHWDEPSALILAWNLCGAAVIIAWSGVLTYVITALLNATRPSLLRVSADTEEFGLDRYYHGGEAYNILPCSCMKHFGEGSDERKITKELERSAYVNWGGSVGRFAGESEAIKKMKEIVGESSGKETSSSTTTTSPHATTVSSLNI